MPTQLIPFSFESREIRSMFIDGNPWFVGKDICDALGYANASDALNQHCRGVAKCYPIVDSLGRTQEVRVINEPDTYRLIIGSTLPAAERFEAWLFEWVLPSIRKTGSYALPATIPANTALVPILSHMEMARIAPLAPGTRQHIQQVFQSIQDLTARERKAQRVDCRVILETVVQDILSWRYGCPYAYGFNVAGRAYLQTCSGHITYHLRTAPHFRPVFEKMNWLDERKIMNEWDAAGLAMKTKASLRMDGSRLDLLINLSRLTVAASSPATQELLQ